MERNLEFKSGGEYFDPIPELEKAGQKISGINSIIRIRKGSQYIDIPIMNDTKFIYKSEKALQKAINRAIKMLDSEVYPKKGFHKDMESGTLQDWQQRHRKHDVLKSREPYSKC